MRFNPVKYIKKHRISITYFTVVLVLLYFLDPQKVSFGNPDFLIPSFMVIFISLLGIGVLIIKLEN